MARRMPNSADFVSTLVIAMETVTSHKFALWDALILAAAAEARCRLLLSEDMQDGFAWRSVTIRNPFTSAAPTPPPPPPPAVAR